MVDSGNTSPRTVMAVALRLDSGSVLLKRWLGCWIDMIVVAACLFGPFLLLSALGQESVGSWLEHFPKSVKRLSDRKML